MNIGEGLKLYYNAEYEAAIPKFKQALEILPRADATQVDYDRAVRGLSDCYGYLADAAMRAGDKEKAEQHAKKALEYVSTNRSAENIIIILKLSEQEAAARAEHEKREAPKPKPVEAVSTDKKKIEDQLKEIKFPEITFCKAAISDVVEFLSKESVKVDPKGEGVNIVLGPGVSGGKTITLSLRNVRMDRTLEYITSLAGMKYRVEGIAVVLLPADGVEVERVTPSRSQR
jgi:general secretion pathway protein D